MLGRYVIYNYNDDESYNFRSFRSPSTGGVNELFVVHCRSLVHFQLVPREKLTVLRYCPLYLYETS